MSKWVFLLRNKLFLKANVLQWADISEEHSFNLQAFSNCANLSGIQLVWATDTSRQQKNGIQSETEAE